jgi:hypothetical protein
MLMFDEEIVGVELVLTMYTGLIESNFKYRQWQFSEL